MIAPNEEEVKAGEQNSIPPVLPILPIGDIVVYPFMVFPIAVPADEARTKLIDEAAAADKMVGLFAQSKQTDQPSFDDFYRVGTAATIVRMLKLPDGTIQALLQGRSRVRMSESVQTEPYLKATVEELSDQLEDTVELKALQRNATTLFEKMIALATNSSQEIGAALATIQEPSKLADFMAANTNLSLGERQELLETLNVTERFRKLTSLLNREVEILEIGNKIQSQVKDEMDKAQRDYYLREQLKAIQK